MELPTQDRQPALSRSGHVLALYGGLALLALLVSAGRGHVNILQLHEPDGRLPAILALLLGFVFGGLVVLLSRVAHRHYRWARRLNREFRTVLGGLTHREIVVLALASSLGEELLFRGALMPWMGLWLQALLFAGLHIGPGKQFAPWTLLSFAMGVAFGQLALSTGSLGAPIVAHATINYFNLRFIASDDSRDSPVGHRTAPDPA